MSLSRALSAVLTLIALVGPATAAPAGDDWTSWRGPDNTGYVADANPPIEWSETKNIRWKVEIPGRGHSTPIVLGDRIYLMTAIELSDEQEADAAAEVTQDRPERGGPRVAEGMEPQDRPRRGRRGGQERAPLKPHKFVVMALNRADGKVIWSKTVREEMPHEGIHPTSTFASASPVTDGTHLWANFGSRGLFCLDLDGNVVWEKDLGDQRTRNGFGEGASPAVHGDTIVVPWDHEDDSFVVALDKKTGDEKWRRDRDEPTGWATPIITEVNGRAQTILPGTNACIAYDLDTGDEVWRSSGLTRNIVPTPIIGNGMVYLTSGFRGNELLAIRLESARGDVTGTDAIVWTHNRGTPYIPSPMLTGERLYFLGSTSGILSCFNAITGEPYYTGQRLEVVKNVYASIGGAGKHVYICGREGNCEVLEEGPEFKRVAINTLDEGINASPVIVGDVIYLRGDKHLYCIAGNAE